MDLTPFEYGGLHLSRNSGLNRRIDFTAAYRYPAWGRMRTPTYSPASSPTPTAAFMKRPRQKTADIFRCVEDGRLYVPCGDGLRHYDERPGSERGRKHER